MVTRITTKGGIALILVVLAGSTASACGSSTAATGSTATGSPVGTPANGGSVPGASGLTLTSLNAAVKTQIVTSRPKGLGFGKIGVANVICAPPTEWVTSARWTCTAYSRKGLSLGTYTGITEPDGSENGVNAPEWSGGFRRRG
jgi:hypothetical protein